MVKARTWLALVVVSLGTLAATVSCGSDEVTGGGTGGGLITGGSSSGGAGGKGGAVGRGGTGGTAAANTSALGQQCTADADCGTGLTCVLPTDPNVGAANGLCTVACANNGECDDISPGSACVNFADATASSPAVAYCLEGCTQGAPADITTKCHGRPDEACSGFTSGTGATATTVFLCSPLCRADADCGGGLFCDPGTGSCTKTKPTGDPVGTPCDPMATTNTCLGGCLTTSDMGVTPATGVCVQICSGLTECMYNGTKPSGFCVGALTQDFDILDLGFCEPSCNCTSDCKITGEVCQAWTSAAAMIQADLGSDGFCYPNSLGSTELTCGEGGAGGTGNTPGGETAGAAGN